MFKAVLLFGVLPGLFGYGSSREAEAACRAWAADGINHEYVRYESEAVTYSRSEAREIAKRIAYSSLHEGKSDWQRQSTVATLTDRWMQTAKEWKQIEIPMTIHARRCELEQETDQWLGLESPSVRTAGGWSESKQWPDDHTVIKRFRF